MTAKKQVEQSIWSVRINSQTLYKKFIDGRTVLLGMTAEENKIVAEVLDKAFDELVEILKHHTTEHEAPTLKQPITTTDTLRHNSLTDDDQSDETVSLDSSVTESQEEAESENPQENEETNENQKTDDEAVEEESNTQNTTAPHSRVTRGPGGKFVSKKASNGSDKEDKVKTGGSSFFKKLIS